MTVALYGGAFDPPHLGHEAVLAAACAAYGRVVLMPSAEPPHKALAALTPGDAHRLAMTALLAEGFGNAEVSDFEISRGGRRYTADTLEWLRGAHPGARLALVVGGDMFLTLPGWRSFENIVQMTEIAVACRSGAEMERAAVLEAAGRYAAEWSARVKLLEHRAADVSSTAIRSALSDGGARRDAAGLPERVKAYILEHGLYYPGNK